MRFLATCSLPDYDDTQKVVHAVVPRTGGRGAAVIIVKHPVKLSGLTLDQGQVIALSEFLTRPSHGARIMLPNVINEEEEAYDLEVSNRQEDGEAVFFTVYPPGMEELGVRVSSKAAVHFGGVLSFGFKMPSTYKEFRGHTWPNSTAQHYAEEMIRSEEDYDAIVSTLTIG